MASLPATGMIDADGHILEPATLWEDYLEQRFRARAIRVVRDEQGLEVLEVAGERFPFLRAGALGMLGSMGEPVEAFTAFGERLYMDSMPFGAGNAVERVERCEREHLDRVVLYPTIGILWECAVRDSELADAYARAYNRWIADFCRDSRGRLVPIAHLTLGDPARAATELRRAVADGCRGAFVLPWTATRTPHGHPDHDELFATAQDLDVPLAIHPGYEPADATVVTRFRGLTGMIADDPLDNWFTNVCVRQGMQQVLTSFFAYGCFERFPRLKLGILESAAGWIGAYLDRLDALHEVPLGLVTQLKQRPSEYFRRQCFISADPDERAAPLIIEHVGADCFVWASDFPHPDHPADWPEKMARFIEPLSEQSRRKVLGDNVRRLYGLE